jgi:hypothetical protein
MYLRGYWGKDPKARWPARCRIGTSELIPWGENGSPDVKGSFKVIDLRNAGTGAGTGDRRKGIRVNFQFSCRADDSLFDVSIERGIDESPAPNPNQQGESNAIPKYVQVS